MGIVPGDFVQDKTKPGKIFVVLEIMLASGSRPVVRMGNMALSPNRPYKEMAFWTEFSDIEDLTTLNKQTVKLLYGLGGDAYKNYF